MLKRGLHIVLSAWLAVLLVFGTAPKEFLHLYADHTDTVHACDTDCGSDGTLVIEEAHHHCDFLSYHLPPFVQAEALVFQKYVAEIYHSYNVPLSETPLLAYIYTTPLRGPPAA